MNNSELFELLGRFEKSPLRSLKLSTSEFTLELDRGESAPTGSAPISAAVPAPAPEAKEADGTTINASLVGTFYAASAPDQPPYVSVGTRVSKGQTVCLIEAMKMMNEVPAPCDCVIEELLKDDGQMVAFGEPLFRYTPC